MEMSNKLNSLKWQYSSMLKYVYNIHSKTVHMISQGMFVTLSTLHWLFTKLYEIYIQ